ncbi:hypothetical protein T05_12872 [Trichinella murrelli]|uniref:Uncharacterized protein n=1 Tax=Trichinella murrelli TaxID=144512 RepID=A0A0V0UBH5_9BILA|nr:hypothetical protein T05_12872 [Trichinella murrelli]
MVVKNSAVLQKIVIITEINFVLIKEKSFSGKLQNLMGYRLSCFLRKSAKEMFDFGANFHRPIILVVELAILLDLRAVVVLVFLV